MESLHALSCRNQKKVDDRFVLPYLSAGYNGSHTLTSKIKQVMMALKPGVVTLKYPFEPHPVPADFRGQPSWDHHKCIGCGGCAAHCPARTIMMRDICQEVRVMVYDGSRCTYCGRCSDVCPVRCHHYDRPI